MGWTATALTHSRPVSALEAIRAELGDGIVPRVLAHARKPASSRDGHVVYAAVRAHNDPDTVFGVVLLMSTGSSAWSDGRELRTKAMDETQGPAEDECPKTILDLLSDTDHERALEWRRRCRQNLTVAAACTAKAAAVKPGTRLKFEQPLRFNDDAELDEFTYEGKSIFVAGGTRYRISRWKSRPFTVLG